MIIFDIARTFFTYNFHIRINEFFARKIQGETDSDR